MIVAIAIVGITGILLNLFGYLIWKKQNLSLLHDYHYAHVSEADKPAFCRLTGLGLILIGLGILLTAVLLGITQAMWSFLAFGAGFAAGLPLLIHAGYQYNSAYKS